MSDIKSQEQIDEMRKRLYARGPGNPTLERHALTDRTVDVARSWAKPGTAPTPEVPAVVPAEPAAVASLTLDTTHAEDETEEAPPRRRYRSIVLIGSLLIFIIGVGLSSLFLFFGGNKISSEFIDLSLAGPATVGSGETLSFQVSVTNQNSVAIESATLVVKYPEGSRTVTEPFRNVQEERIAIDTIAPGDIKNVPVQIAIFGKLNDQKQISATLEYRLSDSNGMFYKETDPLSFQITSTPLSLDVSAIRNVAAGQPIDVTVTATSNATTPLKNVLITATYPNGFSFTKSEPQPIYGQNVWKIDEILPGKEVKITIRGAITGHTEDTFGMSFTAGQAATDNQFIVGSLLNDARTEFVIEHPFIDVGINIAGDADQSVVLEDGAQSQVDVTIKNTLDESMYDMVVEVVPSGNALTASSIKSSNGFYDSNKGLVRWDSAGDGSFGQVNPGDERRLGFSITPRSGNTAGSFDLVVNVYARRSGGGQSQLIGTAKATARYVSQVTLGSQAEVMTGPVPPVVGQVTSYLVTMVAEAGSNDVGNAIVRTSLPTYVEWRNDFTGEGAVEYNPVSKTLQWNAGDIKARTRKEFVFSVSILPSVSQVGITPVLVNQQELRALDRFTNTELTANAQPVSTQLSAEAGYGENNGTVTQ